MNTKLRQKVKNNFKRYFFKLINNPVFGKTVNNVRKHRNTKIVTKERRKKLFNIRTKLSHYKIFTEKLLPIAMRKPQKLMNKPVYLGLSILDLSKTVKPKYREDTKLCYMDTDSLHCSCKNRLYL